MVQTAPRARWGGMATLWGGLTGLLLALIILGARLVEVGVRARAALAGAQGGPFWLRALVALMGLLAFFLAGFFAARITRVVEAGIVAGLLAGVITGAAIALLVLISAVGSGGRLAGRLAVRFPHAALGPSLARAVLALLLMGLLATGLGALGGMAGRGRRGTAEVGVPYMAPLSFPISQGQWWPPTTDAHDVDDVVTIEGEGRNTQPQRVEGDSGTSPTFQ